MREPTKHDIVGHDHDLDTVVEAFAIKRDPMIAVQWHAEIAHIDFEANAHSSRSTRSCSLKMFRAKKLFFDPTVKTPSYWYQLMCVTGCHHSITISSRKKFWLFLTADRYCLTTSKLKHSNVGFINHAPTWNQTKLQWLIQQNKTFSDRLKGKEAREKRKGMGHEVSAETETIAVWVRVQGQTAIH